MKCFPEKEEAAKTLSIMFTDALTDVVFTAVQFSHYAGLRIDSIAYAIGKATAGIYHRIAKQSDRGSKMTLEDRMNFLCLIRDSMSQGFNDYIEDVDKNKDVRPTSRVEKIEE